MADAVLLKDHKDSASPSESPAPNEKDQEQIRLIAEILECEKNHFAELRGDWSGSNKKLPLIREKEVDELCQFAKRNRNNPALQAKAMEALFAYGTLDGWMSRYIDAKLTALVKDVSDAYKEKQSGKPANEAAAAALPGLQIVDRSKADEKLPDQKASPFRKLFDSIAGNSGVDLNLRLAAMQVEHLSQSTIDKMAGDFFERDQIRVLLLKSGRVSDNGLCQLIISNPKPDLLKLALESGKLSEYSRGLALVRDYVPKNYKVEFLKQGVPARACDTLAADKRAENDLRELALQSGKVSASVAAKVISDKTAPESLRAEAIKSLASAKDAYRDASKSVYELLQDRDSSSLLVKLALESNCYDRGQLVGSKDMPYSTRWQAAKLGPVPDKTTIEVLSQKETPDELKEILMADLLKDQNNPKVKETLRDIACNSEIDVKYREAGILSGLMSQKDLAAACRDMVNTNYDSYKTNKAIDMLSEMEGKEVSADLLLYMQERMVKADLSLDRLCKWQEKWPLLPTLAMQLKELKVHPEFSDKELNELASKLEEKIGREKADEVLANIAAYNNASPRVQQILRLPDEVKVLFAGVFDQSRALPAQNSKLDAAKVLDRLAEGKGIEPFIEKIDERLSELLRLTYDQMLQDQKVVAEKSERVDSQTRCIVDITARDLPGLISREKTQRDLISALQVNEFLVRQAMKDTERDGRLMQEVLAPFIAGQYRILMSGGQKEQAALLAVSASAQLKVMPEPLLSEISRRYKTSQTCQLFVGDPKFHTIAQDSNEAIGIFADLKERAKPDEFGARSSAPGQELQWLAVMASAPIAEAQTRAEVIDARRLQAMKTILREGLGDWSDPADEKGQKTKALMEDFREFEYLSKFFAACHASEKNFLTTKMDSFMKDKCKHFQEFMARIDESTLSDLSATAAKLREAAKLADPVSARELEAAASSMAKTAEFWSDRNNRAQFAELCQHVEKGELSPKAWWEWFATHALDIGITVACCMVVSTMLGPAGAMIAMPFVMAAVREGTGYVSYKAGLKSDPGPLVSYYSGKTKYNPATQRFEPMSDTDITKALAYNAAWDFFGGVAGASAYRFGSYAANRWTWLQKPLFSFRAAGPGAASGGSVEAGSVAARYALAPSLSRKSIDFLKHKGIDYGKECFEGALDDGFMEVVKELVGNKPESFAVLLPILVKRGAKAELSSATMPKTSSVLPHPSQKTKIADPAQLTLSKVKPPDSPLLDASSLAVPDLARGNKAAVKTTVQRILALDPRVREKFLEPRMLFMNTSKELDSALVSAEKCNSLLGHGVDLDYLLSAPESALAGLHQKVASLEEKDRALVVANINMLYGTNKNKELDSYLALAPEKMVDTARADSRPSAGLAVYKRK